MLRQHLSLGQLLQLFLSLQTCHNYQWKNAFLCLLLSHVSLIPSFQTLNRMSRSYTPMSHWSIHLMHPASSHNASSRHLSHLFSKRGVLITMIWTTIGHLLIYALLSRYWKNLPYPKFLPTSTHNPYNTCQSAHRPGHSTEAALLKVVTDLFFSLDKGNISVQALLDFSSAFDTIDHPILVHRLHTDLRFTDAVLQLFSSYLTDRTHCVSLSNHCSAFAPVYSGFNSLPYSFHHVC